MPLSPPSKLSLRSNTRAFTLVELTVVVVVMSILGTLATVSYNAFIKRSNDKSAHASMASVVSELNALTAFNQGVYDPADYQVALDDLPAAMAPGVQAATVWTVANPGEDDPALAISTAYGEVAFGVENARTVGVSMKIKSGDCAYAKAQMTGIVALWVAPGVCSAEVALAGP